MAERLGKYGRILGEEGVSGLTVIELKELLYLSWLKQSGELEIDLLNPQTEGPALQKVEERLETSASQRIEEAKKRIADGKAPFEPEILPHLWHWDSQEKEFIYTGTKKKLRPKDSREDLNLITVGLADLEIPSFSVSPSEGEPGRKI
ncbi:MAG TPA: hypothetical protein VMX77_00040 [Candidatus Bathyarchaeia archaeon]|nr:hypothetical protein [Candidatus Bathyarchaeia archaeon]